MIVNTTFKNPFFSRKCVYHRPLEFRILFDELTQQVGGFRIEAGRRPVWAVCQKQCPQQQQQV